MIVKWRHGIYTLVLVMILMLRLSRLSCRPAVARTLSYTRYVAVFFFIFVLMAARLTDNPHWLWKISLFLAWIFFIFPITCFYSIDCAYKFGLGIACSPWSPSFSINYCAWYIFCIASKWLKALVSIIRIGVMKCGSFILLLHISPEVTNNSRYFKEFWSLKFFNNILELGFLYQISELIETFCATFNLFNLVLWNLKIAQD